MEFPFPEQKSELDPDRHPLLMERLENHNDSEHIIDIAVSSHDDHPSGVDPPQLEEIPSISTIAPTYQTLLSSSNRGNSWNSSSIARGDGYAGHGRSTLNSRLWVSVELFVTVGQVIASVVILSLSRHEHPRAPLFEWVVGYTCGCVATIPVLYWHYRNRMRATEQDSIRSWHGSSQSNPSSEPASYTANSIAQASEEGNRQTGSSAPRISWISPHLSPRYGLACSCLCSEPWRIEMLLLFVSLSRLRNLTFMVFSLFVVIHNQEEYVFFQFLDSIKVHIMFNNEGVKICNRLAHQDKFDWASIELAI